MHMKSNLKLAVSLVAIVIGFGSQWNCTIQIGNPPNQSGGGGDAQPSAGPGCVNQMPTYTLGEPPSKEEYAIIVKEFKPPKNPAEYERFLAEAQGLSATLRTQRVHNSIWEQFDGAIVVSVGRYFTEKQAEDKLAAIHARGHSKAYVARPRTPKNQPEQPPSPSIDFAGIFALMIIAVLVILGVASQTKK